MEEQFYAALLTGLDLADDPELPARHDRAQWPLLRERFAERTRAQWWDVFRGTDACVAPVWSLAEAARDEHLTARHTYIEVDGVVQPAAAPRFSATPPAPEPYGRPVSTAPPSAPNWACRLDRHPLRHVAGIAANPKGGSPKVQVKPR
ncbi:CoA transferase [Streptomyces prunicolor]|uniref:CoA transferase n=1 Tax=Streptomyces prunicolor TaxID=67348 RepID=UPI000371BF28|nr:CoA transferase [Streptomyces prunicolor]